MDEAIRSHVLRDGDTAVTILSIGCAVQDWTVGDRRVVLGYADPEAYRTNPASLGVVCGRVVNRISGAAFTLGGRQWTLPANLPPHHIHGGPGGFGWRHWDLAPDGDRAVRLTLHSPHLDQGYPGALDVSVTLTLDGARLTWEMEAVPDRETPVNLAQHLYFNLAGTGSVRDHALRIRAGHCTPTDAGMPTGEIRTVAGTRFDFSEPRPLGEADPDGRGYDLNYALEAGAGPQAELCAAGMRLCLWTDRPGLQLYTSGGLRSHATPHRGQSHDPSTAICLEAQDFPNALNTSGFGSILCSPEHPYRQVTSIGIAPA